MTSDDLMARICKVMRARLPKCTVCDGGVNRCNSGRGWVATVRVVGCSGRKVTEHSAWSAVNGRAAMNLAVSLGVRTDEQEFCESE